MASRQEELTWNLRLRFADTVINLCVAAIQVFMWTYMLACHVDAPIETRKRRLPYLIASLTILAVFSAGAVMKGLYTYNLLFEILPGFENIAAIRDAYYISQYKVGKLLINIAFRIADGVLVHRCYIVWYDYPWVALLPAFVLLAGTGISLRTYIPLGIDNDNAALDTADVSLTVGLNILLTMLISFRLIRAQRKLSIALPNTSHKIYLGIVAILVESAAPVAIFGIAAIIAAQIYSFPGYRALPVLNIPFVASLILSPQLIIFRVATGHSWSNQADTGAMLSRSLRFTDHDQNRSDAESVSLDPSCR